MRKIFHVFLAVAFNCLIFLLSRLSKRNGEVMIIPPDNPGSIGDEAMVKVLNYHLDSLGIKYKYLGWDRGDSNGVWFDTVLLKKSLFDLSGFRRILDFDSVIIIGADVMDGYYSPFWSYFRWRLCRFYESRNGAIVTPCSFNSNPSWLVKNEISKLKLTKIYARDNLSYKRLLVLSELAKFSTDLAFDYSSIFKVDSVRDEGFVVVNLNPLVFNDGWNGILMSLVEFIKANDGVDFKLLPHDTRPGVGDHGMLNRLHLMLPDDVKERVKLCDDIAGVQDVYRELLGARYIISARMHLAIAALSLGIPALVFSYQDKFEGIISEFDFEFNPCLPKKIELAELMGISGFVLESAANGLCENIRETVLALRLRLRDFYDDLGLVIKVKN